MSQWARPLAYLPTQKSRKMTSRISSTSTRPVRRPRPVAARRRCSATSSSPAPSPLAQARANASATSKRIVCWRWRVTNAGSEVKKPAANRASDAMRISNPWPVGRRDEMHIAAIRQSLLQLGTRLHINQIDFVHDNPTRCLGPYRFERARERPNRPARLCIDHPKHQIRPARASRARRMPSRSTGSSDASRTPAVSSRVDRITI